MHRLYDYLTLLIERAPSRPVLQFNRLDFRLEWFRHRFPEVSLIHLTRNPRDQWLSTFQKQKPFRQDATVAEIGCRDEFYLVSWAKDLSRYIPLLAENADLHPYELSYLIWRLSEVFAENYVDYRLRYESFVQNPRLSIGDLVDRFGLEGLEDLRELGSIDASSVDRWTNYADATWFKERERRCERLLQSFVFENAETDHKHEGPVPMSPNSVSS